MTRVGHVSSPRIDWPRFELFLQQRTIEGLGIAVMASPYLSRWQVLISDVGTPTIMTGDVELLKARVLIHADVKAAIRALERRVGLS